MGFRPESDGGSSIFFAGTANCTEVTNLLAPFKADIPDRSIAPDFNVKAI